MQNTPTPFPAIAGGRAVLITGVSRPLGIGATLAARLARAGAAVALHGYTGFDLEAGHRGAGPYGAETLAAELQAEGHTAVALPGSDLSRPEAPAAVVAAAASALGGLDGLILNHAYSTCAPVGAWTAQHIDAHLTVNVRASMLMLQAFAAQAKGGGAVTLFTSGQYLGPMEEEIAYAVSKEALIGLCTQSAAALSGQGIRVNCVNPGPCDTGYLTGAAYDEVARRFPAGRWGTPEDTADLVQFLHSPAAAWVTGQIIASEGGFRRT